MKRVGPASANVMTDEIFANLQEAGWSVEVTAFHSVAGGLVWVVSGHNGENFIRAEGPSETAAWRAASDQAKAVGMFPGRWISLPEDR